MKQRVGEYLEVDNSSGKSVIQCKKCKHVFCSITENYKNHALVAKHPLTRAGPLYSATQKFVLREFYCPECVTMLDVEMTLPDSPFLFDYQLKAQS